MFKFVVMLWLSSSISVVSHACQLVGDEDNAAARIAGRSGDRLPSRLAQKLAQKEAFESCRQELNESSEAVQGVINNYISATTENASKPVLIAKREKIRREYERQNAELGCSKPSIGNVQECIVLQTDWRQTFADLMAREFKAEASVSN